MQPTPKTVNHDLVYEPCEDSFFMLDCLEKEPKPQYPAAPLVLEIGSGSGIVSTFVHSLWGSKAIYMATDLNLNACENTLQTWELNNPAGTQQIEAIQASLVPLRPRSVDVLIFNPPYVPSEDVPEVPDSKDNDRWIYLALDGGEDGMEVTRLLLDQLDDVLTPTGCAYILFCARNKPKEQQAMMESRGWKVSWLDTRKAGWEVLSVLRFEKVSQN